MSKGPKPVKHPPAAKLRERMLAVLRADQGAFVVKPDDWTRYEWAHAVDSLRCHGYEIEGRSGRQGGGYRLVREPQSSPEVRTATEPAEPPQTPQAGSGETREGGSPGTRRSWDRDWLASPRPPEFGGVDVVCEPGGPARQGDVVVQTFVPVAGQGGPASEDPQMDALVKVVAALLPLDDDGRRWVLECAALRFVGPVLKLGLDT